MGEQPSRARLVPTVVRLLSLAAGVAALVIATAVLWSVGVEWRNVSSLQRTIGIVLAGLAGSFGFVLVAYAAVAGRNSH